MLSPVPERRQVAVTVKSLITKEIPGLVEDDYVCVRQDRSLINRGGKQAYASKNLLVISSWRRQHGWAIAKDNHLVNGLKYWY